MNTINAQQQTTQAKMIAKEVLNLPSDIQVNYPSMPTNLTTVESITQKLPHLDQSNVLTNNIQQSIKINPIGPLACTNETRIVYYVDDEETPYLVKLPIPHSNIKLSDFKAAISLPRPHYKFFFKSYDKEVGVVKEEICDDNALLPIFEYRVVAWVCYYTIININ